MNASQQSSNERQMIRSEAVDVSQRLNTEKQVLRDEARGML